MTIEKREKIQHAIQALIDVESALHSDAADNKRPIEPVLQKLHEARLSLVELNAPDYN